MSPLLHRWFRPLALVVGAAGLTFAAWSQRAAIAAVDWSLHPWTVAAGVGLLAIAPLAQAWTLRLALRRLGAAPCGRSLLRVWGRSFLLRYEPSGAVGFAYRVRERERLGATTPQVLTATGYEQLAAVAGGAVAAVLGFTGAGLHPPLAAWLALAASGALVVALRPAFLGDRLRALLERRGVATAGLLRGRDVWAMVLVNAAGWVATAFGLWLVARAVGLDPQRGLLAGAFALSWLLGVLVPLAPGGLGLRDGALVLWLAGGIGAGAATALALGLRLACFAAELLAVGVAELLALALRPRRASAPAHAVPLPEPDRAGTIVVVPTYDEALTIGAFVARFEATGLELLVVDDASPDGTGAIASELAADRSWMHVLHRAGKDGLGMAYKAGFAWCLERGYRVIGQMDCDLSHPPEKLLEMLAVLDARDADLVLGNRYMPGGGTAGWSAARRALSRIGCTGSKLVLGLPYDDLSGGFKVWRAPCLAELGLESTLSAGYAFQVETTQLAHLLGKRIEQVPFVFTERIAGESKMSLAVSLEGIRVTLALRRARTRPAGFEPATSRSGGGRSIH